jgi:sugar phosphate isomerase/epimerase
MTSEMTRKDFLQTIAGAAASAYVANSSAAAAAPKPKIKLGVTLYSYGGDFQLGTMNLEDCIADVADMGAEGIEILGESHIPNYPNPTDKWVGQWFAMMDKYKTKPMAYDDFVDTMFYKDRLLTPKEAAERLVVDFKLANRLGIPVMRQQWPPYPPDNPADVDLAPYCWSKNAIEVFEHALPYAEKYNVKIAVEMHSPTYLKSEFMDRMMEFILRTKTKHFGFCPDMSIFTKRPPEYATNMALKMGAREKIIQYIISAYQENLGPAKTMAEVKKMGGNETELVFASIGGIYHFSNNDPKDLIKFLPYSYHIHGKFWGMSEDLHEYSVPYENVIPLVAQNGFGGYISSEYEGSRDIYDASIALRRQQLMLRKLWESA